MDKSRASGQTLVELALVLPCFCLGIFMAVQLICYCHNMVELERMAQLTVERMRIGYASDTKHAWLFNSLWGNFTTPNIRRSYQNLDSWRPFNGISTVKVPGQWVSAHLDMTLLASGGFTQTLGSVSEENAVESYLEPPVPPEQ